MVDTRQVLSPEALGQGNTSEASFCTGREELGILGSLHGGHEAQS